MKLQRYLNERMINREPRVNQNPSTSEIDNLMKQSDYEALRALVHGKTENMYVWDASTKTHLFMYDYLHEQGLIPDSVGEYYAVTIHMDTDDDGESFHIEVREFIDKGKPVLGMKRIPFKKINRLKSLFPQGEDMVMR